MRNPTIVRRLAGAVVAADLVAEMATVVLLPVARAATPLHRYGPMRLRLPQRLWWRSPSLRKPLFRRLLRPSLNLNRKCRLVVLAAAVRSGEGTGVGSGLGSGVG